MLKRFKNIEDRSNNQLLAIKNIPRPAIKGENNGSFGNTAAPTGAAFTINDCKLYVPVVTLSKDDEINLLTNLKSGFKREIK